MHKIQQIFNQGYPGYLEQYGMNYESNKVVEAIMGCKTPAMGGNQTTCQDCGKTHLHYNSCRNRHCPCCQSFNKEKWIDAQKADVIDAPYFHAVFTVPEELNPLIYANKWALYKLLYKASSEALMDLARDKKFLGADIGFISVLHTWGSNLSFHPHIHAIVLGGGLTDTGRFVTSDKKFLFPIKVVSKLFRGKFLDYLKKLSLKNTLAYPGELSLLQFPREFNQFLTKLYAKEWIPYLKEPFKSADQVIEYLGRYTHRIAISNSRILEVGDKSVVFRVKDYKTNTEKKLTLGHEEFIRRFLMHVLPKGFVKIRHYGLLSNRTKGKKLKLIRILIKGKIMKPALKDLTGAEILNRLYGIDVDCCRYCGSSNIRRQSLTSVKKIE